MSDINVVIAGKQYRMACEDGQEERLLGLAGEFENRIVDLRRRFGEIGDARLTIMAALMVSDELVDAHQKIENMQNAIGSLQHERDTLNERARTTQSAVAAALNSASGRIEKMTEALKAPRSGAGSAIG
jgi:cell division protein ZapA